jgi:hypothetical protein
MTAERFSTCSLRGNYGCTLNPHIPIIGGNSPSGLRAAVEYPRPHVHGTSKFGLTFDSESIDSAPLQGCSAIGGLGMGPRYHGRRNEPLLRGDEHDEYDEKPESVLSLLEENARLRRLVIKQCSMILKSAAERK